MTERVFWDGVGLADGTFTTSSVGTGDTPAPTFVSTGGGSTIDVASEGLEFDHVTGGSASAPWTFTSGTLHTIVAYFTPRVRTGNRIILRGYNSGTATQIFTLNVTSTGRSNIYNAANSLAVFGASGEIDTDGTEHRVELQVDNAADTIEVRWYIGESTTPFLTQTDTSDYGSALDRIYLGNHLTSSAAESYRFDYLRVRDTADWYGPRPTAGTLDIALNGAADADTFRVLVKTSSATGIELRHSPNSDLSGATTETAVAPDAAGYATLTASSLAADTPYHWRVDVDGIEGALTGQTRTLPAPGTPAAFTFGWSSCFDSPGSAVFANIAARAPDFFVQLGDYGYQYITGGPNGNTAPSTQAECRADREGVLSNIGPRDLFAEVPLDQMYSDCDGGGANSDGTFAGFTSGAVQAAWRQQFAHRTLPLADCGARSWVVGRVRLVLTDETTLASAKGATDDAAKTKLGAAQKAWFKGEIDAAAAAGQVVVWLGDGPWIETAAITGNSYRAYDTERTELGAYIDAAGMSGRLVRLHGDTHTLFADDGTNNPWGGFPCFSAAPMHTTAQPFGTTTSEGSHPASTTNGSRQYGICDVTDDGTTLTLTMRGWSSTNGAPTETNPVTMTLTVPDPSAAGPTAYVLDGGARVPVTGYVLDGGARVPVQPRP